MEATDTLAHAENRGHPRFTEEGHTAGMNSLLHGARHPAEVVFGLIDTPRHGYEFMAPMFSWTAVGCAGEFLTLWYRATSDRPWNVRDARFPAVFPPNLATGVPISWVDERPDPREGDPDEVPWGYPVRIYVHAGGGLHGPYPTDVKVELTVLATGRRVDCQIQSDPTGMHADRATGTVKFVLLPRRVLEPNTRYRVRGSWMYDGARQSLDSTFETGTLHGQYRTKSEAWLRR
jgi:hypothetical protein